MFPPNPRLEVQCEAKPLSYESPTDPIEALSPASTRRWVYRIEVYCDPASLWWIRSLTLCPNRSRFHNAISNASNGRSVFIDLAARQPTIIRENTSITKAT